MDKDSKTKHPSEKKDGSIRSILRDDKLRFKSCREEVNKRDELRKIRKELNDKRAECERDQFETMSKFFHRPRHLETQAKDDRASLKDLLEGLFTFYVSRKVENPSYRLYLRDFIRLFPRDRELRLYDENVKVPRRQHVFEALCRILLVLGYDNGQWGNTVKEFYPKLETYKDGDTPLSKLSILNNKINDGSSAGSVDIFFQVPKSSKKQQKSKEKEKNNLPTCIRYANKDEPQGNENLFVLVQNKFYEEEKGDADKYDINKIYNRANVLREKAGNENVQISLMVNNRERLLAKQANAKYSDFGPVNSRNIFGLSELDVWFQSLLFDMYNSIKNSDIASELNISESFGQFYRKATQNMEKGKPALSLKFHQEVVVNTTMAYIARENEAHKKFVWGAVPRSGKSYMIGGLIQRRHAMLESGGNNVLLVLGAKTETENQFVEDLFSRYDDFKDYNIIKNKSDMRKANPKQKYILIQSQEMFKIKSKKSLNSKFEQLQEIYSPILDSGNKIDFYFDEIHKGGTAEGSIRDIVGSIQRADISIDLFVMVTATYAKPLGTYGSFVDNRAPVVIEWSYEDNQLMKSVDNIDSREQILQSRDNGTKTETDINLEKRIFNEVLSSYEDRYGPDYLSVLASEYQKYPSLVLIQPQVEVGNDAENKFLTHEGLFDLKCEAIPSDDSELRNPEKIFKNNAGVLQFLKFIGEMKSVATETSNSLDNSETLGDRVYLNKNCVYGRLSNRRTYNYDVLSRRHSELWFLPDKNLYGDDIVAECRKRIKTKGLNMTGNDEDIDRGDEQDNKSNSLPNIEPLARGLALNMMNSDRMPFQKFYCVAIVTNQKAYYYDDVKRQGEQYIFQEDKCVGSYGHRKVSKETSIQDWIKEKESNAFKNGKNLIIMTGSMLRLGISLPCVDVALNFDTITSVDTNYQTMFRVLTEREGKTHGYYVDFHRDRTIQFLYQFSDLYGRKMKNKKFTEVLDYTALLFNINGIALGERSTNESLTLYNTLVKQLKLNETDYEKWAFKNNSMKTNLLRLFETTGDVLASIDTQLMRAMEKTENVNYRAKTKMLVKGKPLLSAYAKDVNAELPTDISADSPDNVITNELNVKEIIASQLEMIVPILAIFSNDIGCDRITTCLRLLIDNVKHDSGPLCDCNEAMYDVLACYLERLYTTDFKKDDYLSLLTTLQHILTLKDARMSKVIDYINFSFDNIRKVMGTKDGLIYDMDYGRIIEMIEKYLPVRKAEKDKYGEVFTPASLINEMFDQLPKKVWSDPNLKWLDPANGVGNFPMIAFSRLDKGLTKKIPDDRKRKEHIVKNMLYMVELNEKNVAVAKKVFGKEANVHCGSFLEDGWKKSFGIDAFDIIMGNPPFNAEQEHDGKKGGGDSLWPDFVKDSLDLLVKNGFLLFVHPAAWRKPESKSSKTSGLFKLMSQDNTMVFLEIHDAKDGKRVFNAGTRYDFYLIQKTPNNNVETRIIGQDGLTYSVNMNTISFLPNFDISHVLKLFNKEPNNSENVIFSSTQYETRRIWTKDHETGTFRFPLVNSTALNAKTAMYYTNTKEPEVKNFVPMFGVPKVIYGDSRGNPIDDYNGIYGMTQHAFGLKVKSPKESNQIAKALRTDTFQVILDSLSYSNFQVDWRLFTYLKQDWYKIVLDMDKKQPKKKRTLKVVDKIPSKKTRKTSSKSSSSSGSNLKNRSSSKSSVSNKKGGKAKTLKRITRLHKRHTVSKSTMKN